MRPWPAEAPPVDGSLGAAFRRIWIDAINPAIFVASQREMLDETVARWPQQQAWIDADGEPRERALADLVLPEPYSSAYGGEPVHGEVVADNEAPTMRTGRPTPTRWVKLPEQRTPHPGGGHVPAPGAAAASADRLRRSRGPSRRTVARLRA